MQATPIDVQAGSAAILPHASLDGDQTIALQQQLAEQEIALEQAAAIVDLQARMLRCARLSEACDVAARSLADYFQDSVVGIGLRATGRGACRLRVVSNTRRLDHRSEAARAAESAA